MKQFLNKSAMERKEKLRELKHLHNEADRSSDADLQESSESSDADLQESSEDSEYMYTVKKVKINNK